MSVESKLTGDGPKRLLSLDGGGIRGIVALGILEKLEDTLRRETGRDTDFRLAHYFDYIAGTSTGAIIAACLSLGMSVQQVQTFYEDSGPDMFDKASWLRRFRYKFDDERLADKLRSVFQGYAPDN